MNGETASIWLRVAAEGRCTPTEVARALGKPYSKTDKVMRQLEAAGMLSVFPTEPLQYGVTSDCYVPRGITLAEIDHATGKAAR